MMIGIGSDLVDIRRIEALMGNHEKRFIARCFTKAERAAAEAREEGGLRVMTYAKRFAAKEACAKALGTGINHGVFLRDIGVVNDADGRPSLVLTGGALETLKSLTPTGFEAVIHLTLSDEPPLAQAFVVIEARPQKP